MYVFTMACGQPSQLDRILVLVICCCIAHDSNVLAAYKTQHFLSHVIAEVRNLRAAYLGGAGSRFLMRLPSSFQPRFPSSEGLTLPRKSASKLTALAVAGDFISSVPPCSMPSGTHGSSTEVNMAEGFHEWVIQERTRQKSISLITWTMSDTPSLLSCAIGDTEHPDRMWEDPWKDVNIREQHPWGSSRSLASIIIPWQMADSYTCVHGQ